MKAIIAIILGVFVVASTVAQRTDSSIVASQNLTQYNYYMSKSRNANTIGGILVGTGGLLVIAGLTQTNQDSEDFATGMANAFMGTALIVLGGAVVIGSIPAFARGAKFKREAQLLLNMNTARLPYAPMNSGVAPQMTVIIKF